MMESLTYSGKHGAMRLAQEFENKTLEDALRARKKETEEKRERGCDYCRDNAVNVTLNKNAYIRLDEDRLQIGNLTDDCEEPITFEINYCPMCGRKLAK